MAEQNIRVLKITGDPYQRSFEHAQKLGREALSGSLDFYRNFWDIKTAHFLPGAPKHVQRSLTKLINRMVVKPGTMDWRLMLRDRETLKGYSKGVDSAVTYKELKCASAVPDAFNYCLGWLYKTLGVTMPEPPVIGSGLGCSSLVAWGRATTDGDMIFGRNLDFFTGDKWINNATLLVVEPGPGEIPFASISSAGIPIEGITALNSEGLTVSVHQNFNKAINRRGRSIISLTNEIAACARTINQAIDIATKRLPTSGWTIVVGSAAENEAVLIETSAGDYDVIFPEPGKPWLCCANSYLSPLLQRDEFIPGYALHEHNHARLFRMSELLESNAGSITPELMAVMLGDHYDPVSERERPMGNTIAAIHNVTSAVMDPAKQRVWIAQGPAPANTTPAYIGFDIDAIRRGENGDLGSIPGNPYYHSPGYPALREYTLAYQAFDDLDNYRVLYHLEAACRMDPEEPIYAFMLGLFYLKKGSIERALEKLQQAEKPYNSHYRRSLIWLWQGRCYDMLNQSTKAWGYYVKVIENAPPDSKLDKLARNGIKKPFKYGAVKNIVTEFLMGDAQEI